MSFLQTEVKQNGSIRRKEKGKRKMGQREHGNTGPPAAPLTCRKYVSVDF